MLKTLLLNCNGEILSFLSERKAILLLFRNVVDVVDLWPDRIYSVSSSIEHPATLKLKYYVRGNPKKTKFDRRAIFRRDHFVCQYCGKKPKTHELTIDHIFPKSLGGKTDFLNCVTACFKCNSTKSNSSLEKAGMKLLNQPTMPLKYIYNFSDSEHWHKSWNYYFK